MIWQANAAVLLISTGAASGIALGTVVLLSFPLAGPLKHCEEHVI